jgi:hypothetical protein
MPNRPPKRWWRACTKGVGQSGAARDPARVCGAVWSRKTREQKKRAAQGEKTMKHCRTCTKTGKFSKHGRFYRCKKGGKWSKPRKRSKK